ncbi:type II/IV secretion system ATPase subunit [Halorussus halophilus]|uniref:type II/IV secretion system ATPase subunit n=1 Tax=Halorussus halophilus TaxID=2650975 RepID=UPI0034A44817
MSDESRETGTEESETPASEANDEGDGDTPSEETRPVADDSETEATSESERDDAPPEADANERDDAQPDVSFGGEDDEREDSEGQRADSNGPEQSDSDANERDNSDEDEQDEDERIDADADDEPESLDISDDELTSARVTVGQYTWDDCEEDVFWEDGGPPTNWRGKPYPFERDEYLGFDPAETDDQVDAGAEAATGLSAYFEEYLDPDQTPVALGDYLWEHFRYEYYYEESEDGTKVRPRDEDSEVVPFDRSEWVGHDDFPASVFEGGFAVTDLSSDFEDWLDPATTPVTKGEYYWEHFKYEYYYTDTDVTAPERPRDEDGNIERFDEEEWLGFPEEDLEGLLAEGAAKAEELLEVEDERTLDVPEELDEDAFFSTVEGHTTVVNRYDLEKEVALPKKQHFREVDRYWVNKPYSFVVIFHSAKENETKYYLVEPYSTPIEADLTEFLTGKLRSSIKYSSDEVVVEAEEDERGDVIEREALRLLARYDLYAENDGERAEQLKELLERYDETRDSVSETRDSVADSLSRAREETDAALEPLRESLREQFGGDPDEKDAKSAEGDEGEADESEIDDAEPTPDADADAEEVAADGGTVDADDADAQTPSTETPESPDAAGDTDSASEADDEAADLPDTTDDSSLPATEVDDDEPLLERLGVVEYVGVDVSLDPGASLREQTRTLFEAKIEALEPDESGGLDGIMVRPEPVLIEEDDDSLSEYQTEKLLYFLRRNFVGYERIDGIKHDINVEDISVDGYNSPVFVYHTDYEQIITNVYHGQEELDDFVVKMAQRSGKGISKRQPQVDATLPDGSRAQLTLGREVSDHGTNYTIRQFKDVPFTPIDLVNWNTFSLEEMAFLWLAIENHKSLIFAGGTASGKTTSLNAVSLFIPSNTKIVSIEDTREVELPQRNWIASVTRPSFNDDGKGDVDEFDLLEAALRQRPDYIVMGEIRGEEGRTLFQVMSTGHTTYTTFHADTVGEVLKRFTTEPINVSKTLFTALDLVSIQTQTRVKGSKVRRNKSLTEINEYSAENDEINVQDIFQWRAEDDEFMRLSGSNTMQEIMFDRGWDAERLEEEILKRRVILAYLIKNGLNEYTQVAATAQAFINDPDTILTLIANDKLEESLADLREMESVHIDIDPEKEEMVPRPDPNQETYELAQGILAEAEDRLFDQYRGADASVDGLAVALSKGNGPDDRPGTATDQSEDAANGPPETDRDSDPESPPFDVDPDDLGTGVPADLYDEDESVDTDSESPTGEGDDDTENDAEQSMQSEDAFGGFEAAFEDEADDPDGNDDDAADADDNSGRDGVARSSSSDDADDEGDPEDAR